MKKVLFLLMLSLGVSAYAQDPFLQKSDPEAQEQAIQITDQYNKQLALTGEQTLLFQQKVEEFLIRRNEIENQVEGREKLDLLRKLQNEETAEMQDILTRPQLLVYKKIKSNIQPLEVVNKE